MPIRATLAKIADEMIRARLERGWLFEGMDAGAGGAPEEAG
jgi:hypothetical protein